MSLLDRIKILRYKFNKGGYIRETAFRQLVIMILDHVIQTITVIFHLFCDVPEVDGAFAVQHERRAVLIDGKTIFFH